CVALDGRLKVAQYSQWDGYPSGQGLTVYQFAKTLKDTNLESFKQKVSNLKHLSHEDIVAKYAKLGTISEDGDISDETACKFKRNYPHLTRDCGANVLSLIASGQAEEVRLQVEFASDSLFCEWAYVLDLDREVLEVYRGFQESPHSGQRFSATCRGPGDKFYPVALLIEFPFNKLPRTKNSFVKKCSVASDLMDAERQAKKVK